MARPGPDREETGKTRDTQVLDVRMDKSKVELANC